MITKRGRQQFENDCLTAPFLVRKTVEKWRSYPHFVDNLWNDTIKMMSSPQYQHGYPQKMWKNLCK